MSKNSITYEKFEDVIESAHNINILSRPEILTETDEDKSLTIEESQVARVFKKFKKSHPIEKFQALVKWIESKKKFKTKAIYQNLKNFIYFEDDENEKILSEEIEIKCLAVSPNMQYMAVGSDIPCISLWDFVEFKKIGNLETDGKNIISCNCLQMTNDHIFSGGWDSIIRKWDIFTGKVVQNFIGHKAPILSLSLNSEETILLSGAEDNSIFIWELNKNENNMRQILEAHKSPVSSLLFSKNSDIIISAGWDQLIKLWSFIDLSLLYTIEGHSNMIRTMAISPNGRLLASGGDDNIVKVWELESKNEICSFEGHNLRICNIKFSKDGGLLISSSYDKTVKVWNIKKNEPKKTIVFHSAQVTSLFVTSDGKKLISAGFDKNIRIASLHKDYEMHLYEGSQDEVLAIETFPNNRLAISGGKDKSIRIWDINSTKLLREIIDHS